MSHPLKIAFIGGGNMASALIGGMLGTLASAENILVIDHNPQALAQLQTQFSVQTSNIADAALELVDVIVLAVKPQQLHEVALQILPHLKQQLLISVAAGIRAVDLSRWLHGYDKIVRCMPNTPALIGQGMSGLFAMAGVTTDARLVAEGILQAVGQTVFLEQESQIDAVTAISGSGPAYVFYFIEAMQEAALALGLSTEQAKLLSLATFNGAAQLAQASTDSIQVLRERVTSKGGTTYAALTSMQQSEVKQSIIKAIEAAALRSQQLGDELGAQD